MMALAWLARSASLRSTSAETHAARMPVVVSEAGYPLRIRLASGAEVELAAPPQRILPTSASTVDYLIELVPLGRIAAVPAAAYGYSVLARDPDSAPKLPILAAFESEPILTVEPDLVLSDAWQSPSTVALLRKSGVAVVSLPTIEDFASLVDTTRFLAHVLDVEQAGETLVASLERRRASLAATPRSSIRVLPYGNYGSGGSTSGSGTTWDLMIRLAGMRNAAAGAGIAGNAPIDFEQILAIDPDVFLVGALDVAREASTTAALLADEPTLANLTALREGRVVILPSWLYSTSSHHVVTAAEELAARVDAMTGL